MQRLVLCVGDPPSTGGYIQPVSVAYPHTIMGHQAAYIGQGAFCNACKSSGVIAKAGGPYRSTHNGKEVALDRDILVCGCPTPPPLIATRQSIFWVDDRLESMPSTLSTSTQSFVNRGAGLYDEKIKLRDGNGKPLNNAYYTVKLPSGEVIHGVTDSSGYTERIKTDGSKQIYIHIGHAEN